MAADGRRRRDPAVLVAALAAGRTIRDAAREAGVSERTARRRAGDPAFAAAVRGLRDRTLRDTAAALAAQAGATVRALAALRDNADSEAVRLGACRALLEATLKVREAADLEERVSALESEMAPPGGPQRGGNNVPSIAG